MQSCKSSDQNDDDTSSSSPGVRYSDPFVSACLSLSQTLDPRVVSEILNQAPHVSIITQRAGFDALIMIAAANSAPIYIDTILRPFARIIGPEIVLSSALNQMTMSRMSDFRVACQVARAAGFRLHQPASDKGLNLIELATIRGSIEAVKILLELGSPTSAQGFRGLTPVGLAAYYGYNEALQVMVDFGANLNQSELDGQRTPLLLAVEGEQLSTVSLILSLSPGIVDEVAPVSHMTPLSVAIIHNSIPITTALLDSGADLNKSVDGYTPLIIASQFSTAAIVQLLLDRGASLRARTPIGGHSLSVARARLQTLSENSTEEEKQNIIEIIQILESASKKLRPRKGLLFLGVGLTFFILSLAIYIGYKSYKH